MTLLYALALGLGGVLLAATLLTGGDADGDGDGDGVGGLTLALAGPLGSLRFWTFGSLGFGLTGALSTLLGFSPGGAFAFAMLVGVGLGYGLFRAFRWLAREQVTAETTVDDYVGAEARVLLPIRVEGQGKVVVERLSGRFEVTASSGDGRAHAPGELVVIVDRARDGTVMVARP